MKEIRHPTYGLVGYMHEINADYQSLLVIQLPRLTRTLSPASAEDAIKCLKTVPDNKNILLVGCDVNLYELTGSDLSMLKLKGLV